LETALQVIQVRRALVNLGRKLGRLGVMLAFRGQRLKLWMVLVIDKNVGGHFLALAWFGSGCETAATNPTASYKIKNNFMFSPRFRTARAAKRRLLNWTLA
jgi:hypothetical protein